MAPRTQTHAHGYRLVAIYALWSWAFESQALQWLTRNSGIFRRMSAPPTTKPRSKARSATEPSPSVLGNATHAEGPSIPERRRTDIGGVWLNRDGAQVDEHGVLLSLRRVKAMEADHMAVVAEEPVARSPAEFLKNVALDPSRPIHTRMAAAVASAPYYDRKMPLALEGGDPSRPIKSESSLAIRRLQELNPEERKSALLLLEKLGVLPE